MSGSTGKGHHHQPSLIGWIHQVLSWPQNQVRLSLRGNILHVLIDGASSLDQGPLTLALVSALHDTDISGLTPSESPPIYQLFLYGRQKGERHPLWRETIYLNQLEQHLAQLNAPTLEHQPREADHSGAAVVSAHKQDQPDFNGHQWASLNSEDPNSKDPRSANSAPANSAPANGPKFDSEAHPEVSNPKVPDSEAVNGQSTASIQSASIQTSSIQTIDAGKIDPGIPNQGDPGHPEQRAPEQVTSEQGFSPGAEQSHPSSIAALVLSNRSLARRGAPEAIARYLSETLSSLGVWIQVNVKAIPYRSNIPKAVADSSVPKELDSSTSASSTSASSTSASPAPVVESGLPPHPEQRLWIACTAVYSPDPLLIAEPTAQQLRDLNLEGFRDAVLLIQVQGEAQPDWVLRVDLTPPTEMLREWARWGDVAAISRLVNQIVGEQGARVTAELRETTLHLVCAPETDCGTEADLGAEADLGTEQDSIAPDQAKISEPVTALLDTLAPQGIHGLMLYGQARGANTPNWSSWVDLPAAEHTAFAPSTLELAQRGDLPALAFLLNRLLNPDLEWQLRTGGIRIQLLLKDCLLHVMTDPPFVPSNNSLFPSWLIF